MMKSADTGYQTNHQLLEVRRDEEALVNADPEFKLLVDFWKDTATTTEEFEAKPPQFIEYLPEEEGELFLKGMTRPASVNQWPKKVDFHDTGKVSSENIYLPKFFPLTWQIIQADLAKIGMKPTGYWPSYHQSRLFDGEAPLFADFHVDGSKQSYRELYQQDPEGAKPKAQVKRLALYIVAGIPTTEFYQGPAKMEKYDYNRSSFDVWPSGDFHQLSANTDPRHIVAGEPFAIMRMNNLTIHRSPKFHATDETQLNEPTFRPLMRLWCEEWVDIDSYSEITHEQEANQGESLTLEDLYDRLPGLSMTQRLGLVAIDANGKEHTANVGYSSDLHAFAIIQYDEKGNIKSWVPLPTRKNQLNKGGTPTTYIVHDWSPGKTPSPETRFRFAKH